MLKVARELREESESMINTVCGYLLLSFLGSALQSRLDPNFSYSSCTRRFLVIELSLDFVVN